MSAKPTNKPITIKSIMSSLGTLQKPRVFTDRTLLEQVTGVRDKVPEPPPEPKKETPRKEAVSVLPPPISAGEPEPTPLPEPKAEPALEPEPVPEEEPEAVPREEPGQKPSYAYPLLHSAIPNGDLDQLSTLLSWGADGNARSDGRWTLTAAVSHPDSEVGCQMLTLLCKHGGKIDESESEDSPFTPLDLADQSEKLDMVKHIVQVCKANTDMVYPDGETPMTRAILRNHPETVQHLIDGKADVDWRDSFKATYLMRAVRHNNLEIVKILCRANADVNAFDDTGNTALSLSKNDEISTVLKSYGALEKDEILGKALINAVRKMDNKKLTYLLAVGAPPDACDGDGWTALMFATRALSREMIGSLLRFNADINKGPGEKCPLWVAFIDNNPNLADFLLERGADVNAKDDASKWSLLMMAAAQDNIGMLTVLLKHGADLDYEVDGRTALTVAHIQASPILEAARDARSHKAGPDEETLPEDELTGREAEIKRILQSDADMAGKVMQLERMFGALAIPADRGSSTTHLTLPGFSVENEGPMNFAGGAMGLYKLYGTDYDSPLKDRVPVRDAKGVLIFSLSPGKFSELNFSFKGRSYWVAAASIASNGREVTFFFSRPVRNGAAGNFTAKPGLAKYVGSYDIADAFTDLQLCHGLSMMSLMNDKSYDEKRAMSIGQTPEARRFAQRMAEAIQEAAEDCGLGICVLSQEARRILVEKRGLNGQLPFAAFGLITKDGKIAPLVVNSKFTRLFDGSGSYANVMSPEMLRENVIGKIRPSAFEFFEPTMKERCEGSRFSSYYGKEGVEPKAFQVLVAKNIARTGGMKWEDVFKDTRTKKIADLMARNMGAAAGEIGCFVCTMEYDGDLPGFPLNDRFAVGDTIALGIVNGDGLISPVLFTHEEIIYRQSDGIYYHGPFSGTMKFAPLMKELHFE